MVIAEDDDFILDNYKFAEVLISTILIVVFPLNWIFLCIHSIASGSFKPQNFTTVIVIWSAFGGFYPEPESTWWTLPGYNYIGPTHISADS